MNESSCSVCKSLISKDQAYTNVPCNCNIYCKSCAMKMATGGKCKTCKSFFTQMKNDTSKDDDNDTKSKDDDDNNKISTKKDDK